MKRNAKRIGAIAGIVFLLIMYIITLVFALMDGEQAAGWFKASIYCTIVVPVLLYAFQLIYRLLKKRRDENK